MTERIITFIDGKLEGDALTGPYRDAEEGEELKFGHTIKQASNKDLVPVRIYGRSNGKKEVKSK